MTIDAVIVNVADFGAKGDGIADDYTAIQAALNSTIGNKKSVVVFPPGTYNCSNTLIIPKRNIKITGVSTSYGYGERTISNVEIKFTGGDIGIDCVSKYIDSANLYDLADFLSVENITINGNNKINIGIRTAGAVLLQELSVKFCNKAGIHLYDITNQTQLNKCNVFYNGDYGLMITGPNTTIFSVYQSTFRVNRVGIYMECGQLAEFSNCVIESNASYGFQLYGNGKYSDQIRFSHCWFENNSYDSSDLYHILIDAAPSNIVQGVIFENCIISTGSKPQNRGVWIKSCNSAVFENCRFLGGDQNNFIIMDSSNARNVVFTNRRGGPASLVDQGVRTMEMNVKKTGSSGYELQGDLHAKGGRTQTLWFQTQNANAPGIKDLVLDPVMSGTTSDTYPALSSGSLVGITISKKARISAGSITIKPYTKIYWQAAQTPYASSSNISLTRNDRSGYEKQAVYAVEQFTFTAGTHLGVTMDTSSDYRSGGNGEILVGLVIEY
ncbi:hypothetical protein FE783_21040 [Paenibacillus mesophilus]|uniref:right-handed parallel beta-helix repeat-containing protein n=1 Tax=Paenibacillus mesophilus TaxID=2582849 RepID=UPI00110EC69E|nr:right-handed parallel beta-helix repeat-containing protein [Paenibacillus mesophilus]TMV47490.1 hypothetical protein FE783_21040 [Paenibacillus mesophilus]